MRTPTMAVLQMPSPWSLLYVLLLTTHFLLPLASTSTSSAPAPDNNPDVGAPTYNSYIQELFSHDEESPEGVDEAHVVVLTAANFASFLAAHRHVMVDFYAPWCPYSRELAPVYAAAASNIAVELQLDVAVAKINGFKHSKLVRAHNIHGYPTVLFFVDGVQRGYQYNGERTKDAIVAWIIQKLGPAVRNVTTVDEADKIVTGSDD